MTLLGFPSLAQLFNGGVSRPTHKRYGRVNPPSFVSILLKRSVETLVTHVSLTNIEHPYSVWTGIVMALIGLGPGVGKMFTAALVVVVGYVAALAVYNLFFHPLRAFPGPLLWRVSVIPYIASLLSGRMHVKGLALHRRYGPVVRIAPDQLIFADPRAWKDIMGHRGPGEPEMDRAPKFYRIVNNTPVTLLTAPREEHGKLRRQLAHGFSEKSLREQQPIITGYVNALVSRLHESSADGTRALNMVTWYNYATFDIIGDLAFGESFHCLEKGAYDPWISRIFDHIKVAAFLQASAYFPVIRRGLFALMPKRLKKGRDKHRELTTQRLQKRMKLGAERPDLIEGLLKKRDDGLELTLEQLHSTSSTLIIAGSETTASLLSGVTYLLATNPDALQKLTEEVRAGFKTEEEIDFVSVSSLKYMLACLEEGLRMYPPTPTGLPRIVPKGGGTIAGYFVPENTTVQQIHYALYHNEKFFALPEEYHPERWLGDPRFADDTRDIFQPFHVGPRNCIGRNLAYIEMRLILARVLWNFDLKLAEDSKGWLERQNVYLLWEKGPLNVFLTPRSKPEA